MNVISTRFVLNRPAVVFLLLITGHFLHQMVNDPLIASYCLFLDDEVIIVLYDNDNAQVLSVVSADEENRKSFFISLGKI